MAEREGFEPSIRCRIHTFQACSFNHSDTSPDSVFIRRRQIRYLLPHEACSFRDCFLNRARRLHDHNHARNIPMVCQPQENESVPNAYLSADEIQDNVSWSVLLPAAACHRPPDSGYHRRQAVRNRNIPAPYRSPALITAHLARRIPPPPRWSPTPVRAPW